MKRQDVLMVRTTVRDRQTADRLASGLVERRLAACVQLQPIESVYRWQGRIEREREMLLLAKTTARRRDALVAWLAAAHPYEVPEIVVESISAGWPAYLEWVRESVSEELDAEPDRT